MKFIDTEISKLNVNEVNDFCALFINFLCGKKEHKKLTSFEKESITKIIQKADAKGINYAQFNELLLLLEEDRVSELFYTIFFKKNCRLNDLLNGVVNFRGYALLCYGNIRFAYKHLTRINKSHGDNDYLIFKYKVDSSELIKNFKDRPEKALDIDKIGREDTQFIGYLSKQAYENELEKLNDEPGNEKLKKIYKELGAKIEKAQKKALDNTHVYLTWDYMDVYIATSMRTSWEFEETYDISNEIFNNKMLKKLKLRYFDPTQSLCYERINKGLVEGLMIKRAKCTLYMIQDYDTLGKDSELAATLAQGKTVIAYIPEININLYIKKIKKYPLNYFKKKLLLLKAEGILEDEAVMKELNKIGDFNKIIADFICKYEEYKETYPYTYFIQEDDKFKKKCNEFEKICAIIAISEKSNYKKRSYVLKERHPLAIQVHLDNGVANGVLIVREINDCVRLLKNVLTNSMEFVIEELTKKYDGKNEVKVTVLKEKISNCIYRVATQYEKLSNSFWNFYLKA